jgi:hypothetical protein
MSEKIVVGERRCKDSTSVSFSAFLSPLKKNSKNSKFAKKMSKKIVVGERCKIRGRSGNLSLGRVAFVGPVHYAKGEFVGIVLDRKVRRFSSSIIRRIHTHSHDRERERTMERSRGRSTFSVRIDVE